MFLVLQVTYPRRYLELRSFLSTSGQCNSLRPMWDLNIQSLFSNQLETLLKDPTVNFLAQISNLFLDLFFRHFQLFSTIVICF